MKVLFLTRKWPPAVGGMETYSRDLTSELARLTELEIYALPGRANGLPPSGFALAFFFARAAFHLLRNRRSWDLIHFGDFVLFPLAWVHAQVSPNTPRLITVHGLDVIFGNRSGWKAALYRVFIRWARRRRDCIDTIITNSSNTARLVTKAGLGESIAIPLGVTLDTSCMPRNQSVDPKNRYVLFVGRLVQRKGAAWFATEVLPRLPADVTFKIVGKAWDKREEQVLRESPRTEHLGYLSDEDLASLRAEASAVVMPNVPSTGEQDVEGFGITALEAAVGGAPLLAADLEGLSDAVINGVTGFLMAPLRSDLWAEKIRELLQWSPEKRQEFIQEARIRIERDFSWARVARETIAVYQDSLSANKETI